MERGCMLCMESSRRLIFNGSYSSCHGLTEIRSSLEDWLAQVARKRPQIFDVVLVAYADDISNDERGVGVEPLERHLADPV